MAINRSGECGAKPMIKRFLFWRYKTYGTHKFSNEVYVEGFPMNSYRITAVCEQCGGRKDINVSDLELSLYFDRDEMAKIRGMKSWDSVKVTVKK